MDTAGRSGVDLEKELTCSICTEVLYQPLTLLDCLHTFCGSCLKDWFSWQRTAALNTPNRPTSSDQIYTCPSCRAHVRDTRHNATVNTLLEMFLAANPDKAKPEEEKEEMRAKYKPGENVVPQIRVPETSPEERRLEEMERRMLEQARDMSLRDAGMDSSDSSRRRRRHDHTRSEDGRSRSDRESSRDTRHHARRDGEWRPGVDSNRLLQADSSSDERQRRRDGSQQRSRESSRSRRRHVEHQASIRSLISSSDVDSRDLEREIDDFARQIQEEGLLDGLDLDNLDLARNDELSRKITDAYRRRQRERIRTEPARRGNIGATSQPTDASQTRSRPPATDALHPTSRQRSSSAHSSRPPSIVGQTDDRSRPPLASTLLEIPREQERRRRRRTSSSSRSATDPVRPNTAESQPAARSQTDLTLRSQSSDPSVRRPSIETRSTSMPVGNVRSASLSIDRPLIERPSTRNMSFSDRASAAQNVGSPPISQDTHSADKSERPRRNPRPASLVVPQSPLPSLGLLPSPTKRGSHQQRSKSQYYPEPSITCSRCRRPHIEYELHYNCPKCAGGSWNICLDCFRGEKGCLHWFGFGYEAFRRWERQKISTGIDIEPPHMLISSRYRPPPFMPGGAEGRRTLTTDDPAHRLETGVFCARCLAWSNDCYWRCESCNDGDWGFCNNCVNQGYSCSHPLLPLTHVSATMSSSTPPGSPRSSKRPRSATLFTGPNAMSIGNFKPLTFNTTCDICRLTIPPNHRRYHCFSCTSTVVPDTYPGDFDICVQCYSGLVQDGRVSQENGHSGWRRCLNGHRMAIIGFAEGKGGQRRHTVQDLVGGRWFFMEQYEETEQRQPASGSGDTGGLLKWSWPSGTGPDKRSMLERLVTADVAATAPSIPGFVTDYFPPDGGIRTMATAVYSYYPAPDSNELTFPRGAELREIVDYYEDGEWFFGTYMGAMGVFPGPYVRVSDEQQ